MKRITYFSLLLIAYSCAQNVKDTTTYVLDGIQTTEYSNQYNDKGQITRSCYTTTSQYLEFSDVKSINAYDNLYIYDDSGKLIKEELYIINNGIRVLSSIDEYTKDLDIHVSFREYPDDTLSYTYRKKDIHQNVIEEFSKYNLPDHPSITVTKMQYDDQGQMGFMSTEDLITQEVIKRKYQYQTLNDTSITLVSIDDSPFLEMKEYKDIEKQAKVVVTRSLDMSTLDTVYTSANRIYSVAYDYENGYKQESIADLDSLGNWDKVENKTWRKI